jgi:excisionase family DNA binding protein
MVEKRLYSIAEASLYSGFAKKTFYDWIQKRRIDYVKISTRVFIEKNTLDTLIESNKFRALDFCHD